MLSRFDTIPERDGQTDRQTEFLYQYRAFHHALVFDHRCGHAVKLLIGEYLHLSYELQRSER